MAINRSKVQNESTFPKLSNLCKIAYTQLNTQFQYNQKTKKDERDAERAKAAPSVVPVKKKETTSPKPTIKPENPLEAKTQDEWQNKSDSHNGAVR